MENTEMTASATFYHEPSKSWVKMNFTGQKAVDFQQYCYKLLEGQELAILEAKRKDLMTFVGEYELFLDSPPREITVEAHLNTL